MQNSKLTRLSIRLQEILYCFLFILPTLAILLWFILPVPNKLGITTLFYPIDLNMPSTILTLSAKFQCFAVNAIPLGMDMLIIYYLILLFKLYEQGNIFTMHNVTLIRRIGFLMLFQQLLKPFLDAVTSFIVSGHKLIAISFLSTDINNIVTASIILLIAWVMHEGAQLQSEQQLTV